MTKNAQILKLKRQIADATAKLEALQEQLARVESGQTMEQAAEAGDIVLALWKAALGNARTRSSRQQCRKAWNLIPKGDRPDQDTALAALRAWNKCEQWTKDACMFVPGLHKWIANRGWTDVPESRPEVDPLAKYRPVKKAPQAPALPPATADEISEILGSFRTPCSPAATPPKSGENCQIPAESGESGTISLTSYLLEDRPITP